MNVVSNHIHKPYRTACTSLWQLNVSYSLVSVWIKCINNLDVVSYVHDRIEETDRKHKR